MTVQYNFNTNFIDQLYNSIRDKNLLSDYKLSHDCKYNIYYILEIVLLVSSKTNNKYKLPINIVRYFDLSEYSLLSKNSIKNFIKTQIIINNDNYWIIGVNNPIIIKEITVVV